MCSGSANHCVLLPVETDGTHETFGSTVFKREVSGGTNKATWVHW